MTRPVLFCLVTALSVPIVVRAGAPPSVEDRYSEDVLVPLPSSSMGPSRLRSPAVDSEEVLVPLPSNGPTPGRGSVAPPGMNIAPMPQPFPAAPPGPYLNDIDRKVFDDINFIRERNKLRRVTLDPTLCLAAQDLARFMAQTGKFGHDADGKGLGNRIRIRGYRYSLISENIAMCGTNYPGGPAQTFVKNWWDSPGHRDNLLNPYVTETGIATFHGPSGFYSVQVFGRPVR